NLAKNIRKIRKFVRDNADIVISFLSKFNIIMLLSTIGLKVPIIVSNRSDPHYEPKSFILRIFRNYLYNLASSIVTQTQSSKLYFPKKLQNKTYVIENPISINFPTGLGLNCKKEKKIITVGRLIRVKNQKMLIKAFSKISKE